MASKPDDYPVWLTDCLRCPTCSAPMWLTASGEGASCRKAPGHTGTIRLTDVIDKALAQFALALARGQANMKRERIPILCKRWLKASGLTMTSNGEVIV